MLGGAGDRDRLAQLIAGTDPYREFKLVIELLRGTKTRRRRGRILALAVRAADRDPRGPHRGGPAVIADRDVFVVRAERIVRIAPAAAACSRRPAIASSLPRSAPSAASRAETRRRNAKRGPIPSAISAFRLGPAAASAARRASPENSPSASAALRSKILSPIAMPPRGPPPVGGVKMPSGRFWIGNSAWPLAEATQL